MTLRGIPAAGGPVALDVVEVVTGEPKDDEPPLGVLPSRKATAFPPTRSTVGGDSRRWRLAPWMGRANMAGLLVVVVVVVVVAVAWVLGDDDES